MFATAKVEAIRILNAPAPSCQSAFSNPPTSVAYVSTTDASGYLWFSASGIAVGDNIEIEMYQPDGKYWFNGSGAFDPTTASGNYCFTWRFDVAGALPATVTGKWKAHATINSNTFFDFTFDILPPGSGGGGGGGSTGTNLIAGGNAEPTPTFDGCRAAAFPGWTYAGNLQVCKYGTSGIVGPADPGPSDRGQYVYSGGQSDGISTGTTTIDVSSLASTIDSGVAYTLSGWLGGFSGQDDSALLKVTFRNGAGAALGTGQIGPVLSADRNGVTSLISRTATGQVPIGTRRVEVLLQMTRASGAWNDGYADNLSFTIGGSSGGGGGGGGAGGLNLAVNQVIDAACPTNKVIVSVTDNAGNPVTGLTASNFTLTENGETRAITVTPVSSGSAGSALSLALVVDISTSLSTSDLANEKIAAKQLISQLGASDAAAVYSLGSTPKLVLDYTTNKSSLNAAIDGLALSGSTALYQSIKTAAQGLLARSGRRAMVLMTDGQDTVGGATLAEAIAAAKAASAPVFTVGFGTGIDTAELSQIARETGGTYSQGTTSADLQRLLQSIGAVISSQYEITYTATGAASPNAIKITVSQGSLSAQATTTAKPCSSGGGGGGGGGGVIVTPGCNYFINPPNQTVTGSGGTGLVLVNTAAACAWGVRSNDAWIRIDAPAGGSSMGSGAVSYTVPANPSPTARTGTITIANQTHTVTQNPGGGGAGCSFSLSPTSASFAATGGTGGVLVTATTASCPWTATTAASWITITGGLPGTGSGRLNYSVAANTGTSSRTATITIAGVAFGVTQAGAAGSSGPSISGVTNAASNVSANFPGAGIARGSFFSLYGNGLGPQQYQVRTQFPLLTNMGGVRILVTQGNTTVEAVLYFVSATQINAILPSNAPLGDADMIVEYQGVRSPAMRIKVVENYFGIFTTSGGRGPGIIQNYVSAVDLPLNMPSVSARPGQVEILLGTGMGPITAADNQAPPVGDLPVTVEVYVGGKTAKKLYSGRAPGIAGVDQINFEVPADAPLGCFVPVQVRVGQSYSNTATMAISSDGSPCKDAVNPLSNITTGGGKVGVLALIRADVDAAIQAGQPPLQATLDLGAAAFYEAKATGALTYNPLSQIPPQGSCAGTTGSLDISSLLGVGSGASGVPDNQFLGRELDAGDMLSLRGPLGSRTLEHLDTTKKTGPYLSLLGGMIPGLGGGDPLFLDPGSYTFSGTGGKDVGAFTVSYTMPAPVTWTNKAQITQIDRSAGLTFQWSGGDPSQQSVLIAGGGTDQTTKASGGFICLVGVAGGQFTVPPSALANVPVTRAGASSDESLSGIVFGTMPNQNLTTFQASGLDAAMVIHGSLTVKTVTVK